MGPTLHEVLHKNRFPWDARQHKSNILIEIWLELAFLATSLALLHANLNIILAVMQYHSVKRGILTLAQREIDFPHGFWRLWSQTPSCSGVSVWKPQQQIVIWETGHAFNDPCSQMMCWTCVRVKVLVIRPEWKVIYFFVFVWKSCLLLSNV